MNRLGSMTKPAMWSTTLLLAAIVAGCGGGGDGIPPGTVTGQTGGVCTGTGCVNLGTAGNYVILAKAGISTTGTTAVTGNLGVSPIKSIGLTGFGETMDASNIFSTSTYVTGKLYASDYAVPTPANLTTAVSNMETAYTTANGGPAGATCPGGDFGGLTITKGVYDCPAGVGISSQMYLSGSAADVFVFRITGTLTQAAATQVTLQGVLPQNVFWVVSDVVEVGTTAHMEGVILAQTAIHMLTGSSIKGRLLAQSAVTLDASTVTVP